ncbi:MAG: tRNA (cytidine32/uridine32-2-O)-methyltransferase [Pseudomonadota bacterium]|nr:tRNA (cytidine32/uridine32-2-O)-methyltransferase [Pseudomonadota bacterium]
MLPNIRIVLVKTTHPGNIGATARAMKNMGLNRLYLVAPTDFPSFEASQRASSAGDVLEQAVVVDSLQQALHGCAFVAGTTARLRNVTWPQLDARTGGERIFAESRQHEVALVFGSERTGLLNDEMELCQYLVNIPTSEEYASLNLAQAVQVMCYEILMASRAGMPAMKAEPKYELDRLASTEQLDGLYAHIFAAMQQFDFFGTRNHEQVMRRLRCLFGRARVSVRELQILRGMIKVAQGKRAPPRQKPKIR